MAIKTTHTTGDVSVGHDAALGGSARVQGSATIHHNMVVEGWLDAPNVKGVNKGFYTDIESLQEAYPDGSAADGSYAVVGSTIPGVLWYVKGGKWVNSGQSSGALTGDVDGYRRDVEQLQGDLATEASEREQGDASVRTALQTEIGDREKGDASLQGNLTDEVRARAAADASLEDKVAAEAAARAAGDASVGQKASEAVASESSSRAAADAALEEKVDAEATAREQGDHALGDRLEQLRDVLVRQGDVGQVEVWNLDTLTTLESLTTDSQGLYIVTSRLGQATVKVGDMAVFSDGMGHVVTEVLLTHYALTDDGMGIDTDAHTHEVRLYCRSFGFGMAVDDATAQGSWSRWRSLYGDELSIVNARLDALEKKPSNTNGRLVALEDEVFPLSMEVSGSARFEGVLPDKDVTLSASVVRKGITTGSPKATGDVSIDALCSSDNYGLQTAPSSLVSGSSENPTQVTLKKESLAWGRTEVAFTDSVSGAKGTVTVLVLRPAHVWLSPERGVLEIPSSGKATCYPETLSGASWRLPELGVSGKEQVYCVAVAAGNGLPGGPSSWKVSKVVLRDAFGGRREVSMEYVGAVDGLAVWCEAEGEPTFELVVGTTVTVG